MDLLPTFRGATRRYSSAASWVLSSDIRLKAGCASAHRLMLMGMYNMAISKSRLAFMVTTEQEALEGLAILRPGLLIITQQLEQGSGQSVVEQARSLVCDVRTILSWMGRTMIWWPRVAPAPMRCCWRPIASGTNNPLCP